MRAEETRSMGDTWLPTEHSTRLIFPVSPRFEEGASTSADLSICPRLSVAQIQMQALQVIFVLFIFIDFCVR
jgi:hypothetical protein